MDTSHLLRQVGLVVITHFIGSALLAGDSPGVSCVCTIEFGWSQQDNCGGATGLTLLLEVRVVTSDGIWFALQATVHQSLQLYFALVAQKYPVHLEESLLKRLFVVQLDFYACVAVVLHELLLEVLTTKLGYLSTAVAIEHSEERITVSQIRLGYVTILHVGAPALHLGN